MRYTIKIQMDSAAFKENKALEVQAILDKITLGIKTSRCFSGELYEGKLMDHNGNVVGSAKITRT